MRTTGFGAWRVLMRIHCFRSNPTNVTVLCHMRADMTTSIFLRSPSALIPPNLRLFAEKTRGSFETVLTEYGPFIYLPPAFHQVRHTLPQSIRQQHASTLASIATPRVALESERLKQET